MSLCVGHGYVFTQKAEGCYSDLVINLNREV